MNIKVTSEEIIKPSHPTPSHLRYLKTSIFDHVNSPVLMPIIFFYSNKQTPGTSTILDRLKNSLSVALSVFYPLAGRVQDANYITCNDKGVPYVQTQVTSTRLSEVVHKADVSLLDSLLPSHGRQGFSKLVLAIQVNTFACGGIAIGTNTSHAICDAFSIAMFAKAWASIANGESPTSVPHPCFEISKIFPTLESKISATSKKDNLDLIKTRPITKWFMFSKEKCEALRSRLCSNNNDKNRPSLTMVLSAFIWIRIKLACRKGVNDNIPHATFHSVNIRPKLETLSGSCYYFGNMYVNAIAVPSSNDKSLCDSYFTGMEKSTEKIIGKSGFIDGLQNGKEELGFMKEHFVRESKGEIMSLGFSSYRSLPVYESDFGWGKPVWVTSATLLFKDAVIMIPGGVLSRDTYVYVNLSPDEMTLLEQDLEFLSFVTNSAAFVTSKL